MASKKSKLLGGASALYKDQMSGDIYFSYVWTTEGFLQRIVHVNVTYGMSAAVVQMGTCPRVGEEPKDWGIHSPSLTMITVENEGPQYMDVDGAPTILPNSDYSDEEDIYFVDEGMVAARPIPWHHQVTLIPSKPETTLHYHQHANRQGHGPIPPILPVNKGNYREFEKLGFSTQVQSCRVTKGIIREFDPKKAGAS